MRFVKYALLAGWLALFGNSFGQSTASDSVTLDQLRAPTSPAFNIIGIEPESVTRPSTPRALNSALVSSVQQGFLSPNVAVEFAPYWLKSRPKLNYQQYIDPTFKQSVLQSSAFSVATKQVSNNADSSTLLGLGFRTQWLSGRPSNNTLELTKSAYLETMLSSIVGELRNDTTIKNTSSLITRINSKIDAMLDGTQPLPQISGISETEMKGYLKNKAKEVLATAINAQIQLDGETIKTYIRRLQTSGNLLPVSTIQTLTASLKEPVGWIVQSALATSVGFPTNRFQLSEVPKAAAWTTLTYRTDNEKNEFNLMGRYIGSFHDSVSTNFDAGLSLVRINSKFTFSAEAVYRAYWVEVQNVATDGSIRSETKTGDTYRTTVTVAYKVSNVMSFNATVGKDYDNPLVVQKNLLTLFGMSFNLPKGQVMRL